MTEEEERIQRKREKKSEWYHKNRDAHRERLKKGRNVENYNAYRRRKRAENPEKTRSYFNEYRQKNRESYNKAAKDQLRRYRASLSGNAIVKKCQMRHQLARELGIKTQNIPETLVQAKVMLAVVRSKIRDLALTPNL